MRKLVNARDLTVGDILAPTLENEVFSIRQVYTGSNPVTGNKEVTVKGPLGITLKFHANALVRVLINKKEKN